jgi:hypothetical protein
MRSHRTAPLVSTEQFGSWLVSLPDPARDSLFWPTYKVRPAGPPGGPRSLGSFLAHNPSDWHEAAPPYPEHVERALATLAAAAECRRRRGLKRLLARLAGRPGSQLSNRTSIFKSSSS